MTTNEDFPVADLFLFSTQKNPIYPSLALEESLDHWIDKLYVPPRVIGRRNEDAMSTTPA